MVKHWPKISCNGYWSIDLNIGQHIGCQNKHNNGCTWSLERTWPLWAYRRGWPRGRKCRRAWTRWRFPEWRQACKGRDINTRKMVFFCALLHIKSSKIEVDENYSGSWMVHCIAWIRFNSSIIIILVIIMSIIIINYTCDQGRWWEVQWAVRLPPCPKLRCPLQRNW